MWTRIVCLVFLLASLCLPMSSHGQGKRSLLQEDLSLVNALNYGSLLNNTTLSAAISAIGADKRVLFLSTGIWVLSSSVTVPSNITLYIPAGTTVSVGAGATLTLATIPHYDQPYWFAGSGSLLVTDKTWLIDVRVYNAIGDGVADDTAAITAAIAAATTSDGGAVLFACGTYRITSQITVLNKANLALLGPTVSRGTTASAQCVTLEYTASSGSMFHFDGQVGLEIARMSLVYSHAAFPSSSSFIRLDKSAGTVATQGVYIHDCVLQGTAASSKLGILVYMDQTNEVTFERNVFNNALTAIHGPNGLVGGVTNIRIRDNRFETGHAGYPIKIAGYVWVIDGNRFLGVSNGGSAAIATLAQGVVALSYTGNYHNSTVAIAGGTWVQATVGALFGSTIQGNIFTDLGVNSYCVRMLATSIGVAVTGNYVQCGVGVDGGTDVLLAGNYNGSTQPIGNLFPAGRSMATWPSFGAGAPSTGAAIVGPGASGGASGMRVLCVSPTVTPGRLFMSSNGTDCSN